MYRFCVFRWKSIVSRCISGTMCFFYFLGFFVFLFFIFDRGGHWLEIALTLMLLTANTGRDSSGVERMTSNHKAAGSNPARGFSAEYLDSLLLINFRGRKIVFVLHSLLS